MATITCSHCHRNVGEGVEVCPYCKKNPLPKINEIKDDSERHGPKYVIHWRPAPKDPSALEQSQEELKETQQLIRDLTMGSPQTREEAVEHILSQNKDISHELIASLENSELIGKEHVIKVLGRIGPRSSIPILIKFLTNSDRSLKLSALWALYRIGDLRTLPALLETLKDKDPFVRRYAVHILGGMNDRRSVPSLFKTLRDPDAGVRIQAILSLVSLEGKNAVDAVRELIRDSDRLVQKTALESLKVLGVSWFGYWHFIYGGIALFLIVFLLMLIRLLSS